MHIAISNLRAKTNQYNILKNRDQRAEKAVGIHFNDRSVLIILFAYEYCVMTKIY